MSAETDRATPLLVHVRVAVEGPRARQTLETDLYRPRSPTRAGALTQ